MKNYALIIEGFESLLSEAYSKEDKKSASKILNTIKENVEIAKLYSIVHNLKNGETDKDNVDSFINENISFARKLDYNKIKYPFEKGQISENNLYNDIGMVLFEEKTSFNLNQYNKAYNNIKNNLLKPLGIKGKIEKAKKISEGLNSIDEQDKVLVESFLRTPSKERKNIFENTKSECISKIKGMIENTEDSDLKLKMFEAKEMIQEMSFEEKSYIQDMVKIHNLNKQLV